MKLKELPKAPIQIQRDELLENVRLLHIENNDLKSQIQLLTQNDAVLRNEIITKDNIITALKLDISLQKQEIETKDKPLLEKISLLENTIKALEQHITELKTDKEELKIEKTKLNNEIEKFKVVLDDVVSFDSSFNLKQFKDFNIDDLETIKSEEVSGPLQLSGLSLIEENNDV